MFNAAVALGLPVAEMTKGFDTVNFCLSKGLGAPVGSVLVGTKAHIEAARIHRKALGGGMRQAGVLAAAGLIAMQETPALLATDHANARLMAEAVAACEGVWCDLESVQTNIVFFTLLVGGAAEFVARMKAAGVLCSAIGPDQVRLVTHYDVGRAECVRAAELLVGALRTA